MSRGMLDRLLDSVFDDGPFADGELCDGGQCASKEQCARYAGNVDTSKTANLYTVINRDACVCCVYFLEFPDSAYPPSFKRAE